jgi:hypothetical protein
MGIKIEFEQTKPLQFMIDDYYQFHFQFGIGFGEFCELKMAYYDLKERQWLVDGKIFTEFIEKYISVTKNNIDSLEAMFDSFCNNVIAESETALSKGVKPTLEKSFFDIEDLSIFKERYQHLGEENSNG